MEIILKGHIEGGNWVNSPSFYVMSLLSSSLDHHESRLGIFSASGSFSMLAKGMEGVGMSGGFFFEIYDFI